MNQPNLLPTQPATTVEDYQFEPIKGYPMINWHGKRPFRSTRFYPAQLKEIHGPATDGPDFDGWRNKIFWGDNLQVMSHLLKEYRGKVQLVYIDPPFDSKANYKKRVRIRGEQFSNDMSSFEEKQYTDIWTNDEYLQFMYERLILIHELLSANGILFLHCDSAKGHYLKCLVDEIFGADRFVNQIVWKRSDAHNDIGQGAKHLGTIHDMIFLYANGPTHSWNMQYLPLPESTIDNWYRNVEPETGRRFNKADVTGPGGAAKGNPVYEWNGITRAWRYSKKRMEELEKQNRLVYSQSGMPYQKRYLDESKGVALQDWWDDIQMVRGIQRLGEPLYPTEKPEDLLERIIKLASNPGDLVFDCFMGSGTTQAVAMKLGRRFIGADINLGAVQITTKRLIQVAQEIDEAQRKANNTSLQTISFLAEETDDEDIDGIDGEEGTAPPPPPTAFYTGFEVYNVNHYDIFSNPAQAKDMLLAALEIQPLSAGNIFDGTLDGRLVKVMPVNHIATRADLNDLIANLDYNNFERRFAEKPNQPVEHITLICMGHEPDLASHLKQEVHPYKLDVEVVDILRDRQDLQFKRDSEAQVVIKDSNLTIHAFYPMNLLQKLSYMKEDVTEWRELVESIMIDWNYDGAVLTPALVDIPEKNELVIGTYPVPKDAGIVRIKITDLLSESWEGNVRNG